MSNFVLSCTSPVDLNKEQLDNRNIKYMCFKYQLNDDVFTDDFGASLPYAELYQRMIDGAQSKTSQIGVGEYLDYFTAILEQGNDLLHITISSGLSGDYNSATSAALIAKERFPDRKLYVVDSLGASAGYGLIVDKAADLRDEGMDIDTLNEWLTENRLNMHHWFYSSDLTFYVRGGRISKAAGLFGGMLNICPVLNMDNLGRLIPRAKVRTKKRAIMELASRVAQHINDGGNYNDKCYISHSECFEDARALADMVEEACPNIKDGVKIYNIGSTIGCHTGPGTVAVFFWGDKRED